jgi:hypothetical protein
VLVTLDHDYLNDERFPEHRYPGLVILTGGGGDPHTLGISLDAGSIARKCCDGGVPSGLGDAPGIDDPLPMGFQP